MKLELVKLGIKAAPTTLSEEQYEMIEDFFSMGKSRAEILEIMNFDSSYYYRRVKTDIRLQNAEKKGKGTWLDRVQNDIPAAISDMTFGHTKRLRKEFFEVRQNHDGTTVEVMTQVIVEEKHFPGNSALVALLAKQVVPSMINDNANEDDYDKIVNKLSEEDRTRLEEIALEVFKNI